jgi:hypothetical protein
MKNSAKKEEYKCYKCNKLFSSQASLNKHLERKTPCNVTEIKNLDLLKQEISYIKYNLKLLQETVKLILGNIHISNDTHTAIEQIERTYSMANPNVCSSKNNNDSNEDSEQEEIKNENSDERDENDGDEYDRVEGLTKAIKDVILEHYTYNLCPFCKRRISEQKNEHIITCMNEQKIVLSPEAINLSRILDGPMNREILLRICEDNKIDCNTDTEDIIIINSILVHFTIDMLSMHNSSSVT